MGNEVRDGGLLRVEDAMGPVVLVRSDVRLREVARALLDSGVASAVVADAGGTVRGIVTEQHLTLSQRYLRLASIQAPQLNGHWVTPADQMEAACVATATITAAEVMETRLMTAQFGELLSGVVDRMVRREVDYALVWRDAVAVGMLRRRDLLRLIAKASNAATDDPSARTNGWESTPATAPTAGGFWSLWK
jgi:predicted transcriptional regulator